jgi:drug/metabolite transporter (DMT)-like permease
LSPEAPDSLAATSGADARRRLVGIALMIGALACFSLLDACAKWLNPRIGPIVTVWARYAVALVLVALVINPVTQRATWRPKLPGLQLVRSLLLFLSTLCNFVALQYLQLAEATAILFSTPLIVALLAGPMLGEWVGPRRLVAILVGFVGVLVVVRPGFGGMHPAAFMALTGASMYALYSVITRLVSAHDSSSTTIIWSGFVGLALTTPVLPFVWQTPPDAMTWVLMVALGFLGGFGHWLLIVAHGRAPAAVLAPFIYTQILWVALLGWLVFGDVPDLWTISGAGIVTGSGLYLLYRERVRKVRAA